MKISRQHILTALTAGLCASASGLLAAAPASAAPQCSTFATVGSLIAGGGVSCEVGDKTYYGFSTSTISSSATVSFFNIDPFHTITVQAPSGPGNAFMPGTSYSLSYSVKVTDPTSPLRIASFSTGATTSAPGTSWTKTLAGTSITPAGGVVTATVSSPSATSPDTASVPPSQDISFVSTLSVGNNFVTSFTDSLTQTTGTPAPLPLLGAGAAFGFSRKLRNRLRSIA